MALGDSLYEAVIYVRGKMRSLGRMPGSSRCRTGPRRRARAVRRRRIVASDPGEFKRVASAKARITGMPMPTRSTDHTCKAEDRLVTSRGRSSSDCRTGCRIGCESASRRERELRSSDHRLHSARGGDRSVRDPRPRRQAPAAEFRRPGVSGRLAVALSAGGLSREVRDRDRARHALRNQAHELAIADHDRRHELRRAVGRRQGGARARCHRDRAPRPPPATVA